MEKFKCKIRTVPHFPKEGIMFRDITTLLLDAEALRDVTQEFLKKYGPQMEEIDLVVSAESRGFIFGAILAYELNAGFVPLRKPGKLPADTECQEYELEYGTDKFEVHKDAIKKGDKVLIVDDLLATGGTAKAAVDLVERLGGEVKGLAFLIDLSFLNGREKLKGYDVFSLVDYDSE